MLNAMAIGRCRSRPGKDALPGPAIEPRGAEATAAKEGQALAVVPVLGIARPSGFKPCASRRLDATGAGPAALARTVADF